MTKRRAPQRLNPVGLTTGQAKHIRALLKKVGEKGEVLHSERHGGYELQYVRTNQPKTAWQTVSIYSGKTEKKFASKVDALGWLNRPVAPGEIQRMARRAKRRGKVRRVVSKAKRAVRKLTGRSNPKVNPARLRTLTKI